MKSLATQNRRLNQVIKKTPVAIAATLLATAVWAQPADHTTSADALETTSPFAPSGQPTIGPRPFTSFLLRLSSPVEAIGVAVAADNLPADGVGSTDVVVTLKDNNGQTIKGAVDVTVEVDGGARILLPGRKTSESAADRGDIDRIAPGIQSVAADGVLRFKLIAPYKPEAVTLRVSVRGVSEQVTVRYVPELREMIAVGLIEGRIRSDRFDPTKIVPVREDDSFDTELKGFNKEFNGGKSSAGARAAVYLKGKIKGEYLLTLAYDSDKDTDRQLFEEVDPNAFYPVYGDGSVRGVDAQSSKKLYVRVDRNRSYLLYGDYTTSDANVARSLSQYSR
jgi:Invasin, domain 3